MYKRKYYKYKNKYTKWIKENSFDDPDVVDAYDSDDLDPMSDKELVIERDEEDEIDEILEENTKIKKDFEGFNTNAGEFESEDLKQDTFDIGLFAKARGKSFDSNEFDDEDFGKLNKPNKSKILRVDDKDTFDTFTEKYGFINKKDKRPYIKWDVVNKDYKGIFIESSVLSDREDTIPYMGRTVPNWVDYDFNHLDEVIIFKKYRNLIRSKDISKPFKGTVVDEYAIEDTEFSRITDPITNDKILLIDDVKSFDKFTFEYGVIKKNKKNKNKLFIDINWRKLNINYDGFYIDKDNDFYNERYKYAFYDNKLYESWWFKNDIESGVVYLFK